MATTTTVTSTYSGEFIKTYISTALLSGTTIENGGIEVMPNVKYKSTVKKLAISGLIGADSCDFDPTGDVVLTENIIEPLRLKVNLQLCKADYREDWEAVEMGYSAHDNLPPTFEEFLLARIVESIASSIETMIWQGDSANAGEFDGFIKLMTADATVIDEAGTTITASNVLVELGTVVDKIPEQVLVQPDLKIFVAPNVARAYIRALGGFVATIGAAGTDDKGTQWYGGGDLTFDGISIFVANGLASNYMVAAQTSNLKFGTGLMADYNDVRVLDMAETDGSDNVRVIMKFTGAVQYGFGSEIVLYTPV